MSDLIQELIEALFQFLPIAIFLVGLSIYNKNNKPIIAAAFLFSAIFCSCFVLNFPKTIAPINHLSWNWIGKILDFTWPWLVVYKCKWLTADEVGLKLPIKNSSFVLAILLTIPFLAVLLFLIYCIGAGEQATKCNLETLLFQLTMPGLAEEITIRGIQLAILNRYLGKIWKIGGIEFGWGIILVTIIFVLAHVLIMDKSSHHLIFTLKTYGDLITISMVFFAGCLLGYLRERSNSIWPCVVLHNLLNSLPLLFFWIIF